jgi:hypothetical protein
MSVPSQQIDQVIICNSNGDPISTSAVEEFLYISSMAGIPTGVPNQLPYTASRPIVYNSIDEMIHFYTGSRWLTLQFGGGGAGFVLEKDVSLNSTGTIVLGTTPSTSYLYPESVFVQLVAVSGALTLATFSVGTNSPNYDNILSSTLMTSLGLTLNKFIKIPLGASASTAIAAGSQVRANVTAIPVGTATIHVRVVGG